MTEPTVPACPRCGHPDESGRWCNWCGAALQEGDQVPVDTIAFQRPEQRHREPTGTGSTGVRTDPPRSLPVPVAGNGADAGVTPADGHPDDGHPDDGSDSGPADRSDPADRPSEHRPATRPALRRAVVVVGIIALVAAAITLAGPPARTLAAGTRTQATGQVRLGTPADISLEWRHQPSAFVPASPRLEADLLDRSVLLRVDGVTLEVDRADGTVIERVLTPPDASDQPQVVVAESVRLIDPVDGDVLRVVPIPAGWYVLDDRNRGDHLLLARRDPSGLSPFDNLAALDLTGGGLRVFEAEVPQALVGGVLSPEGTRFALVREFDRNGLYIDIEREALTVGQIRMPTPESLVTPESLRVDASGTFVAVSYERSFPGGRVGTTLHLRDRLGDDWDAEVPGTVPVTDLTVVEDGSDAVVLVRHADNTVTAWEDGGATWTVAGPPRLVPTGSVVAGPVDGTVLFRNASPTPWSLLRDDGPTRSSPVQFSDPVVAVDRGYATSRMSDIRVIGTDGDPGLPTRLPVTGRVTAGHGSTIAGTFQSGCGAVCVFDLDTRELLLRTTALPGARGGWHLGPDHVAAELGADEAGTDRRLVVVRIADGAVTAEIDDAELIGPADDRRLAVVIPTFEGPAKLGWLDLDDGDLATVDTPVGARLAAAAVGGDIAVVPTPSGLARIDVDGVVWVTEVSGVTAPPVIVGDDVVVAVGAELVRFSLADGAEVERSEVLPDVVWWLLPAGDALIAGGEGFVARLDLDVAGG